MNIILDFYTVEAIKLPTGKIATTLNEVEELMVLPDGVK